jgi:glycosyltransferase involved in cell wall biosynthesis
VFPSLYEGFGLPILEAMACGVPLVCSRAASIPEVAGDAAEFFEPHSAEDLAAAVERVLKSPELQETLRRKGKERLKQFSWDECARRHCQVFRDVMQD